ncbi:helix-turn-helix transcriptional regulator [Zunongwangia sp. F363]|uniref:Helix-turn-helix transcriptional regulator n=1 Tax=Autumnicola tepida TaxID=3075595 RepID=A0ABU3CDA9_9FLAO|nr:helix-turn-helix transcriptional regulator [Zunongwangia sp. F363]MDT0644315.1 helix-turn-helix transcriptional regulator [Zunongwangia sp. F363]
MSYFGKNIRKIRNAKKLSQQAFAETFDLKRGTLGAYEEERSEPRIETIVKIANYFSISIDDLLTKELTGDKLLKFKDNLPLQGTLKNKSFPKVPCIVPASQQDYIQHYDKPYFIEDLPSLCVPVDPKGVFRGFVISNEDNLENERGFRPNDIVIGEKVEEEDYSKTENGSLVFTLVKERLSLRKLYILGEKVTLKAANKEIEDTEISLTDLKELWLIKYTFMKRVTDNTSALANKLDYLEQEFKKLKEQL